jgi:hypothetical protein
MQMIAHVSVLEHRSHVEGSDRTKRDKKEKKKKKKRKKKKLMQMFDSYAKCKPVFAKKDDGNKT